MCPEHKDVLPERGYEEVNLRDGLAEMVGEQVRERKMKDDVKTVISFENPKSNSIFEQPSYDWQYIHICIHVLVCLCVLVHCIC